MWGAEGLEATLKKLILVALLAGSAVVLEGCQGVHPTTPGQTAYSLEATYQGALTLAVAYRQLPRCAAGGSVICHEPVTVQRLIAADTVAYDALTGFESVVRAGGTAAQIAAAEAAAQKAIADFSAMAQSVKVK